MSLVVSRPGRVYNRRRVVAMAAALAVATGSRAGLVAARQATPGAAASTFLDAGLVHDIAVQFDTNVYDAMVETFSSTGDKEWIEATVSIDGSTYETAGMRLKGNSSLGGLRGGPETGMRPAEPANMEGSTTPNEGEPKTGSTADTPERLPWLVRLDKYVDDQNHEGITELVIRSNRSETSLNEAVALDLLSLAGLASQRAALVRFIVNDSDPALRLTIEHPNDAWMAAHFSPDGLLYKAEAGGDWSYRGDDPAAYKEVFDLEAGGTGDDAEDMQPLFDLLEFINDSDDETFAADLPDHFDVEEFATYLAMMNLIENTDDIDGPGNNAYLYVGSDDTLFTVVPWDMNLAFGGGGGIIISGERPGSGGPGELPSPPEGADIHVQEAGDASTGGWNQPVGGTPVAEKDLHAVGPDGEAMPAPMPSILVERWNAVDAFTGMVEGAEGRLRDELYESGKADEVLSRWVDVLNSQAGDMVDEDAIATESEAIAEYFTREP